MKTQELMNRSDSTAASITRSFVISALKNFVPEDVDAAVDRAINKFAQQMREAAKLELRYQRIQKIQPKSAPKSAI